MVERFQMKTEHDWICARPDPKGDWVRFSDYEALRAELEQVKRERDDTQRAAAFQENNWRQERDLKLGLVEALRAAERLAEARVNVDTLRLLLSHFERLEELPSGEHPHYPSGVRPWGTGDVRQIANELRCALSNPAEPAGEAEPVADEDEREDRIAALPYPDEAPASEVLSYVLSCARLWVPEARIIGNARAGDIVRALTTPPDASAIRGALDIDAILQPLEDIYVRDGFCDWADVANARDEIRRALAGAKP